jgi:RimJ/RimL family protein N-acetyltransferase
MKHAIQREGYGLRLRPVTMADAGFIIALRSHPRVQGKVGDTSPDLAAQQRWIENYLEREGDYYFVVETTAGKAVGTIGIYDIQDGIGQWGRWIIQPEVQAAAFPAVVLVHQVAFEVLGLTALTGSAVSTAEKVLGFHRRFGAEFTHVESKGRCIRGEWVDMVWIRVQAANWPAMFAKLKPLADVAGRALNTPV